MSGCEQGSAGDERGVPHLFQNTPTGCQSPDVQLLFPLRQYPRSDDRYVLSFTVSFGNPLLGEFKAFKVRRRFKNAFLYKNAGEQTSFVSRK